MPSTGCSLHRLLQRRVVDLDLTLVTNGKTVIAHVLHTAIYRLRHLEGA